MKLKLLKAFQGDRNFHRCKKRISNQSLFRRGLGSLCLCPFDCAYENAYYIYEGNKNIDAM